MVDRGGRPAGRKPDGGRRPCRGGGKAIGWKAGGSDDSIGKKCW